MAYHRAIDKEEHPKIVVSKFGDVGNREISHILKIVQECYGRLKPHKVDLVDLCIFERSSSMSGFMAKESKEVGVASASFSELFFAMHDAFRGTSRITLCLEKMKKLPKLVQDAGIRHEVGHSVLHGSLIYYVIPLPPSLSDLVHRFNVSREYATNLLYLISISVKDFEVSRLLYERCYIEDQVAYVKHLLNVTESDRLSWELSRDNPSAEILCLVSSLKMAGCCTPFLVNKTFGEELKRLLTERLSYLRKDFSTSLTNMILKDFPSLGIDTINNINRVAGLVVETIVKPILLRETSRLF
jgi:hypothetical protein